MRTCIATGLLITLTLILSHCATVATPPTAVEAPVSRSQQREAQQRTSIPETKILKRKVAIARFSNETRYGKTLLRDVDQDPLGKQATDMLSTRLVASKKFLIFERPDLSKIEREQIILKDANAQEIRLKASRVKSLKPQPISAMPEALLQNMTAQGAADLLEFLSSLR